MINLKNMTQLGIDIYLYKNFLSKEEIDFYNKIILSIEEKDWHQANPEINWIWHTDPVPEVLEIKDKISKLFSEDLFIGPGNSFVRLLKGAVWGEHSDDYEFKEIIEKSKNYKEGDSYTEETVPVYGLIVYFNNFEGGQIYYPKQNVTYHPKPGDLLIHSSLEHCLHGVKEVKSDVRYSYSNNIRKKIKVPVDGV